MCVSGGRGEFLPLHCNELCDPEKHDINTVLYLAFPAKFDSEFHFLPHRFRLHSHLLKKNII